MAAIPLHDDGVSITYQLDNGQTVKVAKDAAARIGAPLPSTPIAPAADPSFGNTPPMGALPPMASDLGTPLSPPTQFADVAPPAPAPQAALPVASGPDFKIADAVTDKNGRTTLKPVGGDAPIPAGPKAKAAPARQNQAAPATPGIFGEQKAAIDEGEAMQQQALQDRATAEQAADQRIVSTLDERNAKLVELQQKQADAEKDSMAEIERRSKSVDAAVADYGKTTIDPNQLANSKSTGSKAARILFQAVAGLGYALKGEGGKNPAIDMWRQAIADNIRLQMDERDQKRDMIGQQKDGLARFRDLAQSRQGLFNLAMAAETDRAAKTLELVAAQTKNDTVKANALDAAGQLRQQSANAKGEWAKAEFQSDLQSKQLKEQMRSNKAQEGLGWAANKLGRDRLEQDKTEFTWKKEDQQKQLDLEARKLDQAGMGKQGEELRKFGVGAPTTVLKNPDGSTKVDANGNALTTSGMLVQKDGSPFMARTEAQAEKVGNKIAVAQEITDIIDEVQEIREKTTDGIGSGIVGLSAWNNSPEYQQLKLLQDRLVVLAKQGTEGMSSDADMERLASTLGASDLTSFRDRAAGLGAARQRTEHFLNTDLRNTYAYNGSPIKFENVRKNSETASDAAYKDVVGGKTYSQQVDDATPGKARRALEYVTGGDMLYKSSKTKADEIASGEQSSIYGLDSRAQAGADLLNQQLNSRDQKVARNAAQKLIEIANTDPDKAVAIARSIKDGSSDSIYKVMSSALPPAAVQAANKYQPLQYETPTSRAGDAAARLRGR